MKLKTPNNFPIVIAGLEKLDENVLAAAEKGLRKGLEFAKTISMREFLSGPRPKRLDVVTTRLRSSIATSVRRSGKGVIGRIGSNVKYARYHEFGLKGTVSVREHVRHTVDRNWDAGGRRIKFIKDRQGFVIGEKRESVKQAQRRGVEFVRETVKAHKRRVNYEGRPFIKPALLKAQPLIKQAILDAIKLVKAT